MTNVVRSCSQVGFKDDGKESIELSREQFRLGLELCWLQQLESWLHPRTLVPVSGEALGDLSQDYQVPRTVCRGVEIFLAPQKVITNIR